MRRLQSFSQARATSALSLSISLRPRQALDEYNMIFLTLSSTCTSIFYPLRDILTLANT